MRGITRSFPGVRALALDPDIPPDTLVRRLNVAQCQLVETAKAVSAAAGIIVLDEPTACLTGHEKRKLFEVIRSLKNLCFPQGNKGIYSALQLDQSSMRQDNGSGGSMDFGSEMLAARVRRFRLQKKMSIEQLAKAAGVDKNTVVRIEKGEGRPNLSTLMRICGILEVSVDTLMDLESVENQDYYLYRRGESSGVDESEPGLRVGDLKAKLPCGKMNAVVLEITGEGRMRSHPGEEITFCLKGKVGVMIGSTPVVLERGDSVLFFGREPHKYYNADKAGNAPMALALCVWMDEAVDPQAEYLSSYHL